jgi:acyl-CoA thioester hydrolase
VVYHTNYLAFCERARSEIFFQNGIDFSESGFVVRDLSATFYSPAKLGDLLEVKTTIDSIKRSVVSLIQYIYKDEKIIFKLKVRLVHLKNNKITSIPDEYKDIFSKIKI